MVLPTKRSWSHQWIDYRGWIRIVLRCCLWVGGHMIRLAVLACHYSVYFSTWTYLSTWYFRAQQMKLIQTSILIPMNPSQWFTTLGRCSMIGTFASASRNPCNRSSRAEFRLARLAKTQISTITKLQRCLIQPRGGVDRKRWDSMDFWCSTQFIKPRVPRLT